MESLDVGLAMYIGARGGMGITAVIDAIYAARLAQLLDMLYQLHRTLSSDDH